MFPSPVPGTHNQPPPASLNIPGSSELGSLGVAARSGGGLGSLFAGPTPKDPLPRPPPIGNPDLAANAAAKAAAVARAKAGTPGGLGPIPNGPGSGVLNDAEFPSLIARPPPPGIFPLHPHRPLSSPTAHLVAAAVPTAQHFSHLLNNVPGGPLGPSLPPQSRNAYANFVKSSTLESAPEFRIQNEDFPALPGAPAPGEGGSGGGGGGAASVVAAHALANLAPGQEPQDPRGLSSGQSGAKTGIQTGPDGRVTGIPAGMLCDQFGMAGLLTFLRAIESEPVIVALALGHDLTTLGLNLNAPEKNLYQSFGGPWAEHSVRPADIDFHVPEEYLTNVWIRDKLPPIKLNRFQDDTLFYLFYNFGGDFLQTAAAAELYSRDWRYHKEERVWLTRAPQCVPVEQTQTFERGAYNVFEPSHWRKVVKEMVLEYSKLEERPVLGQSGGAGGAGSNVPSAHHLPTPNPHSNPNGPTAPAPFPSSTSTSPRHASRPR